MMKIYGISGIEVENSNLEHLRMYPFTNQILSVNHNEGMYSFSVRAVCARKFYIDIRHVPRSAENSSWVGQVSLELIWPC